MSRLKNFFRNATLALGFTVAAAGCQNWETNLEDKLVTKGFTEEQAEVGAAVGLRRVFTEKVEKDDGTVTYTLNYDGIKSSEVLQVIEEMYADIEWMLEFEGSIGKMKYLQNTGRGEHYRKQLKIYKYLKDVLREKVLHQKFKKLVGQRSQYGYGHSFRKHLPEDQFKVKEKEKCTLGTIFPLNRKEAEFDADYVKKARERGDLKDSKKKVEEISTRYEFLEKVLNPQYVVDYGEEKWIFKKRTAGLKIESFNLDNDKERSVDYIEVFRLKKDGKPESKPAIKVFKSSRSDSLEVIVADRDFEGEGGYGKPDYVGKRHSIKSGRDLVELSKLIDFIFQKKKDEEKRQVPELQEMNKLHIVKAGTLPMTPYDCKNGCWDRFLPDYKKGPGNHPSRYEVHVRMDIPDNVDKEDSHHMSFPLKWIALEYSGGSRVVEFYKPKKEFENKKLKVDVDWRSGISTVRIEDEKGQIKNYDVKAIIEDKPYRIDFDRNQHKRWEMLDKDGDGKCYECKREKAKPERIIPER